jgi:uncharacterized protein YjbJ (UPF0337 family)
MDKDRIKGKMEDVGGRIERQVGEWTGDKEAQVEGAKHQVKGKVRNAAGKVKDAARGATKEEHDRHSGHKATDVDGVDDLDREEGVA